MEIHHPDACGNPYGDSDDSGREQLHGCDVKRRQRRVGDRFVPHPLYFQVVSVGSQVCEPQVCEPNDECTRKGFRVRV